MLENPQHPHTRDLISSVPLVGGAGFLSASAHAVAPKRSSREPLLTFNGVSKVYGNLTTLHPLSFTLQGDMPQIISIVGQSGSGKSTLGSIILGFTQPTTGTALFEGRDLQRIGIAEALEFRKDVQAVLPGSLCMLQPILSRETCPGLSVQTLWSRRDDAHIQRRWRKSVPSLAWILISSFHAFHQLSGGQRQRLIVARALMLSPKLLVADEPVSMVDASLRATILSNIYDLKEKFGISIPVHHTRPCHGISCLGLCNGAIQGPCGRGWATSAGHRRPRASLHPTAD